MVMQQFDTHLFGECPIILPGMRLFGADIARCETDVVIIYQGNSGISRKRQVQVVIGECETSKQIEEGDVANLVSVARRLEKAGYQAYVVFAKLTPFTPNELKMCLGANDPFHHGAIILGPDDLEPFLIPDAYGDFEQLALWTHRKYFKSHGTTN